MLCFWTSLLFLDTILRAKISSQIAFGFKNVTAALANPTAIKQQYPSHWPCNMKLRAKNIPRARKASEGCYLIKFVKNCIYT